MSNNNLELALVMTADGKVLSAEVTKAGDKVEKFNDQLDKNRSSADSAGKSVLTYSEKSKKAAASSNSLTASVGKTVREFFSLKTLIGGISLSLLINTTSTLADEYNVLQTRIQTATKVTGDYVSVSKQLNAISHDNGVALQTTTELFQGLARVAPELNASNREMLSLTNAVQQLGVIGGSSTAQMNNGLLQFTQGLGAGVFRAEEMNSVLENTPEIAVRIAQGMGMTVGELRNAVLEGEVLSKDVFNSLLKQAPDIAAEFENIPLSLSRAKVQLSNAIAQVLGELDQSRGIIGEIAGGISGIAATLSQPETIDTINAWVSGFSTLAEIAAVGGIVYVGLTALPVTIAAVSAGLTTLAFNAAATWLALQAGVPVLQVLNTSLYGTSVSALAASGALGTLKVAAGVLFAAFAGWEIGSYLRDEFLEARLFGLAFVEAMLKGWEHLKFAFKAVMTAIDSAWSALIAGMKKKFGDWISSVAGLLENIPGFGGLAESMNEYSASLITAASSGETLTSRLENLTQERDKEINQITQTISDMVDFEIAMENASDAVETHTAKKVEQKEASNELLTTLQQETQLLTRELEALNNGKEATIAFNREKYIQQQLRKLNTSTLIPSEISKLREEIAAQYDLQQAISQQTEAMKAQEEQLKQNNTVWQEWMTDIVYHVIDGADSIRDVFKRLLNDLKRIAAESVIKVVLGINGGGGNLLSSATNFLTGGQGGIGSLFSGSGSGLLGGLGNLGTNLLGGISSLGLKGASWLANAGFYDASNFALNLTGNGGAAGFGQAVGTAAPWVGGIGGALYGYNQSGVKGAVSGGLGGWGGAQLGMAIAGPIGALVGGLLGGAVGGSLFGGKWETKDAGLELGVSDGNFFGQQYEYQKKKKSLFRGSKRRTNYTELDGDLSGSLSEILDTTKSSIVESLNTLGFDITDAALTSFSSAAAKISTKGLDEAGIQSAVTEWFAGVADDMTRFAQQESVDVSDVVSWLNDIPEEYRAMAEAYAGYSQSFSAMQSVQVESYDRLLELAGTLSSVNSSFENLNLTLFDSSVAGAELAESLINTFGGIENLTNATANYYDKFFTDDEKFADLEKALSDSLASLNVVLPDTREGFRALVESLDQTNQSGQTTFASLMALVDPLDIYYSELERQESVLESAAQSVDEYNAALNRTNATALSKELTAALGRVSDAFEDAAAEAEQVFLSLSSSITNSRTNLQSNVLTLQRANPAFSDVGYQNNAIAGLRSQLGAGSVADQITVVDELQSAIMNRYQSEANLVEAARQTAISQFNAQQDAARAAHDTRVQEYETLQQLAGTIRDSLVSAQLSDLSPLTAQERLSTAKNEYGRLLLRAQAGDVGAASGVADARNAYLQEASSFFASSQAFVDIFNSTQQEMSVLASNLGNIQSPGNYVAQAFDDSMFAAQLVSLQEASIAELMGLDETLAALQEQANAEYQEQITAVEEQRVADQAVVLAEMQSQTELLGQLPGAIAALEARIAEGNAAAAQQIQLMQQQVAAINASAQQTNQRLQTLNERIDDNTQVMEVAVNGY